MNDYEIARLFGNPNYLSPLVLAALKGFQGYDKVAGPAAPKPPDGDDLAEELTVRIIFVDELPELERVRMWRDEALQRAGYNLDARQVLAGRLDIDLHHACDLLASGASQSEALGILL